MTPLSPEIGRCPNCNSEDEAKGVVTVWYWSA